MLFGYPISATAGNWLHDCLNEMITQIHADIDAGRTHLVWPNNIPASYKLRISSRTGLRDRIDLYKNGVSALSDTDRRRILLALSRQNEIKKLLSRSRNCETLEALPESIRGAISSLFEFSFDLLTDLKIRDPHYKIIYDAIEDRVCPFCGYETFDSPEGPREALDHYLLKDKYPFAAANLNNLVPMGNKCNSRYKLVQDILYKDSGARRRAFFPYNLIKVNITLQASKPFGGEADKPKWKVGFKRDTEEVKTWNDVFKIKERYIRDILNPEYEGLLRGFSSWCKSTGSAIRTKKQVINAIGRYVRFLEDEGISNKAFLKAAVFRMLEKHCKKGNVRLIKIMTDLAKSSIS